MTLYAIFDPRPGSDDLPRAVPERFSWLAAILPPVYLLSHGLWFATLGWLLGSGALVVLSAFIGGGATFLLYVLGALWLGLSVPDWRRLNLARQGWRYRGERVALSADLALLGALR